MKKKETKNIDQKTKKMHSKEQCCRISSPMVSKEKLKTTKITGLKILTAQQLLQRFTIALAQVKAGNNPKNLLNGIRQIVCSLYQSKEITKKVYNNLIKSNQL